LKRSIIRNGAPMQNQSRWRKPRNVGNPTKVSGVKTLALTIH
jgi:hypothetical protein